MMTRLMIHLAFVIVATMTGGMLGGLAGREVGRLSPSFVTSLAANGSNGSVPKGFQPSEFGLGIGSVAGLFFGAGSALVIVTLSLLRDAWQARLDLTRALAESHR